MTTVDIFLLISLFVVVFSVIYVVFNGWINKSTIIKRTRSVIGQEQVNKIEHQVGLIDHVAKFVEPVSKLSIPAEGWENSPLQLKFVNAGIRSKKEQKIFFAVKSILALTLPTLVVVSFNIGFITTDENNFLLLIFFAAAIGLFGPNYYLDNKVASRKMDIANSLPDAMDLLIICMSAGLSFDNSLTKVAKEVALKSAILSDELDLYLLEVRTGYTRERALRNLATRTGLNEMDILASTIIQAEKLGSSLTDAMRIYAQTARTKRRQKAEEAAGKIALKLLFPLLTCLMPATFIVLLAPSIMQLSGMLVN